MIVRLAAGAIAATCSVILLASCSSGSGSTGAEQSGSTPAATSTTGNTADSPSSAPGPGASSTARAKTSKAETAATVKVTIKDFKYQVPVSVKPGQKVIVTNSDDVNHTVTSDKDGLFDVVVDSGGDTKTFTAPKKPGKYPFHCTYHANMHGTLVVS